MLPGTGRQNGTRGPADDTSYAKGRASGAALGTDGDGDASVLTALRMIHDGIHEEKARNKGNVALDLAAGARAGRPSCSPPPSSSKEEEEDADPTRRVRETLSRESARGQFRTPYGPSSTGRR